MVGGATAVVLLSYKVTESALHARLEEIFCQKTVIVFLGFAAFIIGSILAHNPRK